MIGVYDSGQGGKSVLQELVKLLPEEDFAYYADTKYCPYGPRPVSEVIERACVVADFLIEKGCELIVVACNTATAAAIDHLRSHYDIPFIGMEPAVKPAVLQSKTGVVGVLATKGTFKGSLYLHTLAKFKEDVKVIQQVGEGLVETVEKGVLDGPEVETLVHKCIDPMLEAGADHIVLGCTHYPFLQPVIERIAGENVTIINPAPAVARQTKKILESIKGIEPSSGKKGSVSYYSSLEN